jgi:dihydroorotase-like cyclic amidohydrolase
MCIWKCPSWAPIPPTISIRHPRGACRRHHDGRRFLPALAGQSLLEAIQMWDNKSTMANCDYSFHMAITWWGEQVFNEMETVVRERGINTFKHFMAYKGALMVNDDEMFASFQRCAELGALPLVHAENGDVVADLSGKLLAEGNNGPEAHAYSRPPRWKAKPPTAPS